MTAPADGLLRWVRFAEKGRRHACREKVGLHWLPLCGAPAERSYSVSKTVAVDEACDTCRPIANRLLAGEP